jgi:hypothetical protein
MESNISERLYVSQAQLQKGHDIPTLLLSNNNHCQTIHNHHSQLHQLINNTQRSLDSESLLSRTAQPNFSESTTAVQNPKHQKKKKKKRHLHLKCSRPETPRNEGNEEELTHMLKRSHFEQPLLQIYNHTK